MEGQMSGKDPIVLLLGLRLEARVESAGPERAGISGDGVSAANDADDLVRVTGATQAAGASGQRAGAEIGVGKQRGGELPRIQRSQQRFSVIADVVVARGELGPPVEIRTDVAFELALDVIAGAVTALRDVAALVDAVQVFVEAVAGLVGVIGPEPIADGVVDRSRHSAFDKGLAEIVVAGTNLGLEVARGALGDIVD